MIATTKLHLIPDHEQRDKSVIEIAETNSENRKNSKPERYNEGSVNDKGILTIHVDTIHKK